MSREEVAAREKSLVGRGVMLTCMVGGVVSVPFAYVVARSLRVPQPYTLVAALMLGALATLVSSVALKALQHAAASSLLAFVNPVDSRKEQDAPISGSMIDSMLAAGRHIDALALLERRIGTDDRDYEAAALAAELHLQMPGGVREAIKKWVALRNSQDTPIGLRIRAALRLADVFTDRLGNTSAAQSQLKWIVATFPRSRAAIHAREALERSLTAGPNRP